jgi:hypothetical protein
VTDFFADPLWEGVREEAVGKGLSMRRQGWFGAAMAHNAELAYTGLTDIQQELEGRFVLREGAAASRAGSNGSGPKPNGQPNGRPNGKPAARSGARRTTAASRAR